MKHSNKTVLRLVVASVAALSAGAVAQAAEQPSPEVMKSFYGPWNARGGAQQQAAGERPDPAQQSTINDRRFPPTLEAKLTPWARAGWDKFKAAAIAVTKGETEKEPPTPDNNCLPFSMPGELVSTGWPMTVQVTPTIVGIQQQIDTQLRLVYMNKQHPANPPLTMHGHSVGHWEGDTLVIDTIGYDPRAQFTDGYIHGPKLHSVERYRVIDGGKTLEKTFTFDDPDSLKEPYVITRTMKRDTNDVPEYLNAQNNTLYECPTAEHGTPYKPLQ